MYTPPNPRQTLNSLADILRGHLPNTTLGQALTQHPTIAQTLQAYISQRFITQTLPPDPVERDPIFWETIATILSGLDPKDMHNTIDLFFEVADPRSVYHILAPLLRELFFPSILEPILLKKIQSENPTIRANTKEMDYFLFQARSHFSMSPAGRSQFDTLAAQ